MKTKELDLTVIDFIAFLELPQDVRIVQKGSTLYTGSITSIPPIILNEKIIRISIVFCTDIIRIEIE